MVVIVIHQHLNLPQNEEKLFLRPTSCFPLGRGPSVKIKTLGWMKIKEN